MISRTSMGRAHVIAALLCFSGTAVFVETARAETVPPQEATQVSYLKHPGTEVYWGRAVGVVKAPFDVVKRVVEDYGKYSEFVPNCRVSRVLARRGFNALVYYEARVLRDTTTLWAQLRIFARRPQGAQGQTWVIEGLKMQGNVDRAAARWELTPTDQGRSTLVAFQFLVDPKLPLPASLVSKQNAKTARKTIEALRERLRKRS